MIDIRLKKLAEMIINYSLNVQPGEKVLIESSKNCSDMIKYLIELISMRNATPLVLMRENDITRSLIKHGSKDSFEIIKKQMEVLLENVDVYINMMDSDNCFDMSDVPAEKRNLYQEYYFRPINFGIIIPEKRWITVDYPSVSSAQQFGMSTESYEEYFFNAINIDYKFLYDCMVPLKEILDRGKEVQIIGPKTNLIFGINGYKSVICSGNINIPDGEVFIAPELQTMNGQIQFNTISRYHGKEFKNVNLNFKNGIVSSFHSDENLKALEDILRSSPGNCQVGEFAIGTNPNIYKPKTNILFDEKILGSIHIALGNSHDLSDNGNRGTIHWDIVRMMTEEYGGGQILIDGELIQQDGIFIPKELKLLNRKKE